MKTSFCVVLTFSFTLFCLIFVIVPNITHGAGWSTTASMNTARESHSATRLLNGKVLVVGGYTSVYANTIATSAELYDPVFATWSNVATMVTPRAEHTATLLPNGKVLIAGGAISYGSSLASTELYDPGTNTWSSAGNMAFARARHTATLLNNGKVLVTGGGDAVFDGGPVQDSAELYDPATNTWTIVRSMSIGRRSHTATLLLDGTVLVVGGEYVASAEYYDPATNSWNSAGNMVSARSRHTATLLPDGKVLIVGGLVWSLSLNTAEVCDPVSGIWSNAASMDDSLYNHTATLLPNGRIMVIGESSRYYTPVAMSYDPGTNSWTNNMHSLLAGIRHTATLLFNGNVLVAGGTTGGIVRASTELYDITTNVWKNLASMPYACTAHTATLQNNGNSLYSNDNILVAGGFGSSFDTLFVIGRFIQYSVKADGWSDSSYNIMLPRVLHTATLLPNNIVLVAGGIDSYNVHKSAEQLPGYYAFVGGMTDSRADHTATLLLNGNVFVAGGFSYDNYLASSEQYNPGATTWSASASMSTARGAHTATLLPNGKVLVAGGGNEFTSFASAELYDPATNHWSSAGNMASARESHTATLLNNGKVLVTGGFNDITDTFQADAELYDPMTNSWSRAGSMANAREVHTATLLPNGKVLVTGGWNGFNALGNVEIFNPVTNSWNTMASMSVPRENHTATLLPNGEVVVIGGDDGTKPLASSELYSPPVENAAIVTLGNLLQTYNGTPRQATASTTPAGLSVNITYNGSPIPPTGVGTYTVLATVSDSNYAGKSIGTLTIYPAGTMYSLEILLNNAAGGSVINSTTQTACGGVNCTSLLYPSIYLLKADPAEYFLFNGWSGACSGTWYCNVTLTGNSSVTASFMFDSYHSVWLDNPPQYLSAITPAFNSSAENATIKTWGVEYSEGLNLYNVKNVTLKGGYNSDYTEVIGRTTIHGKVIVRGGRVNFNKIAIR